MRVEFSTESKSDLADIYYFIAQDNPYRAKTFTDELFEKAKDLALSALHFPLYEVDLAVRRRPYKGYFIFYTHNTHSVIILRILNSKRDYSNLFRRV